MLEQSYELLGLTEEATLRELKKRFRTLSAKHHPGKKLHKTILFVFASRLL